MVDDVEMGNRKTDICDDLAQHTIQAFYLAIGLPIVMYWWEHKTDTTSLSPLRL